MLCKILKSVYGRDTRSAQMVNILFTGVWLAMLLLHHRTMITLDLPTVIQLGIVDVIIVALLATMFSVVGLTTTGKRHQVFKFFGLSLGAVFYGILANGYFTAYPPLDMMLVICLALVVWFVGGLLYIVRCEGLDGRFTARY